MHQTLFMVTLCNRADHYVIFMLFLCSALYCMLEVADSIIHLLIGKYRRTQAIFPTVFVL